MIDEPMIEENALVPIAMVVMFTLGFVAGAVFVGLIWGLA